MLLVSSPFDAFILEEAGQLTEQVFFQYRELSASGPPRFTQVRTGKAALAALAKQRFDLILTMTSLSGMGINAFFTFSLVIGTGMAWQTALGAVFLSGVVFIVLSVTNVRTIILEAIPTSLRHAVAAGIGIFLTMIGLTNVGFIVSNPATVVGFG